MAKCARCSTETGLYMNGVPICIKCDESPKEVAPSNAPPKRPAQAQDCQASPSKTART